MFQRLALVYLTACLVLLPLLGEAQKVTDPSIKKQYVTRRITDAPPKLDGKLDDPVWQTVDWAEDFTQREPADNAHPSQQTAFKMVYDDKFLYVGVRAFDTKPDKIVSRLSRRDGFEGDWVEVNIDSYFDKRTAFSFTASVSGVRSDEYISNNGEEWDDNWNPIWYLKTSIDEKGWVAEMKIPFSQLRFADVEKHVWGIQVNRRFFRNDEKSNWQYIPLNNAGWVHYFGELHGIEGIKPQKPLELQPYVVGLTQRSEREVGNPFATGSHSEVTFGLNGKIGLSNNTMLDFTVNPDFGQVEADPAQVNLSAFQVFFRERRPFFIEGNSILNFEVTSTESGGGYSSDNLFYSRRIGRSPQHYPEVDDDAYLDQPNNTSILGAYKITGKNADGLSYAFQQAVTAQETAAIEYDGERSSIVVEPMTNYFVARGQQDFSEGKTVIGGMVTTVHRDIKGKDQLGFLHQSAYTSGLDIRHNFKSRKHYLWANVIYSHVQGSAESIRNTQESGEHFFQRPDAAHVTLDTTRTSLSGTGGTVTLGRRSSRFTYQTGVTWRSPELELNDAGFMRNADMISQYAWAGFRLLQKPKGILRSWRWNWNQYLDWDFGGRNRGFSFNTNTHLQLKNYWNWGIGSTVRPRNFSNFDLRGGPAIRYPANANLWTYLGTNAQKKFRVNVNPWMFWGLENNASATGLSFNFRIQPTNALNLNIQPSINTSQNDNQYIATEEHQGQDRYIIGRISQHTYRIKLRISYSILPDMTIQYYGEAFTSSGEYSHFRRMTSPTARQYQDRHHQFLPTEVSYDTDQALYQIDEDANGVTDYHIENPDFNYVQLRINLVARWEYTPGSTLFLVWTQARTDDIGIGQPNQLGDLFGGLLGTFPQNTFLLKFTYRYIR